MICIITGDIIGSRRLKEDWLLSLKSGLKYITTRDTKWEIFRGDSFQLEVKPADALHTILYLKACIKVTKQADVRMGIGIGEKLTTVRRLAESSGTAFIHSGYAFDSLKKNKTSLVIKTQSDDFDAEINTCLKLALIAMDGWSTVTATIVKLALEEGESLQQELAQIVGRSQSSVSEALKRAHFDELLELDQLYRKKITQLINA